MEVRPLNEDAVPPKDTFVDPRVRELFVSFELAIEPANIALVTVLVSPVVTIVPFVAGIVIMVLVPATAAGISSTEPEVEPGIVTESIPFKANELEDLPRATPVVPMYVVGAAVAIAVT